MAYQRTDGHRPMQHDAKSIAEFIEAYRAHMRMRRLSLHTKKSYLTYIRRTLEFHRQKPQQMGEAQVEQFLTHLVMHDHIARATQNVAFSALFYLYREILGVELENVNALRSQQPRRAPVVLSKSEIQRVFAQCEKGRAMGRVPFCYNVMAVLNRSGYRSFLRRSSRRQRKISPLSSACSTHLSIH